MPSSTNQEVMGEGEVGHGVRKVVTVCPTPEELRLTLTSPLAGSQLVCPVQGCRAFTFKKQRSLLQHISAMHPQLNLCKGGSNKEKGEDYHFHCPQADCVYNSNLKQRWFSSLDHLRYHYINTHDEKRFVCGKCGKRFGWKRDQDYHERECGQTFACGTCPARYPSRRSLLTHCLRKQHPVPAQHEKPAGKVKDTSKTSPSTQPVAQSTVSTVRPPLSLASPAASSLSGASSSIRLLVPSGVSSPVLSSACAGVSAISSPAVIPGSSGGESAIVLPSTVPGMSVAVMPPTSCALSGVSRAMTLSASKDVSVPSVTAAAVSVSATDGCGHSSVRIVTSACGPGVTGCAPGVSPQVTLSSGDNASLASFSTSVESLQTLRLSQPSWSGADVFAESLPPVSLPQSAVSHTASAATSSQLGVPPSVDTATTALCSDNAATFSHSETDDSVSRLCTTQTISAQPSSSVGTITTTQTRANKHESSVTTTQTRTIKHKSSVTPTQTHTTKHNSSGVTSRTTPMKSTTPGAGVRKKWRPILPKSQPGVVLVGANPPTLYTAQNAGPGSECVLHSPVLPWLRQNMVDAETARESQEGRGAGVSTACEVGTSREVTSEAGERSRVQVPVVHMATQVSRGALHPLRLCHTGTQVYAPAVLRGHSIHTAVQTCVQTAHSGTQLAAPLPGGPSQDRTGGVLERPPEEERSRQVCAVAIQTGHTVDTVNMAIQATGHHLDPLTTRGIMLDVISLCGGHPENEGVLGEQVAGSLSGTHTASQTSFPYILLNKANSTNSTGTQVATDMATEELDVASRGMQTSVTLIHRPKLGTMAAQTQTWSDTSGSRSPRSYSKAPGRVRKRSTKCSEVQTQPCSPNTKKGRRKGMDLTQGMHTVDIREISIATQTLTQETPHHTRSSKTSAGWSSNADHQHKNRSTRNKHSKGGRTKEVGKSIAARSPHSQQNPPLSVSAAQEDHSVVWDPFLSCPVPAPSSPPPHELSPQLEDLLSDYRVELGVQTPQEFLSELTADFGMQTMDGMLSTTSDLGVQTLDEGQQRCTAELGVQTVTSALGCLLENLEADFPCSGLEADVLYPTPSSLSSFQSSSSDTDTAGQTLILQTAGQNNKSFSSAPQVQSMGSQAFDLSLDASIPSPHTGEAPKLFDSFDSDLSFSDCGTGTEDFFASTHTQTGGVEVTMEEEEDSLPSALSSLYSQSGLEVSMSLPPAVSTGENGRGVQCASQVDVFATATGASDTLSSGMEPDVNVDFCPSPGCGPSSRPTSSSTTDTDLLSGVPATDMHTQTADDLLTFLMNNMETQTTEDLGVTDKMAVADTHTQTSSTVLLTPPHPFSSWDRSPSSAWEGERVVSLSAETQTSAQLMWDFHQDQDKFFDLTDMETQTMLW
ncbi:hypothetical protein ACOMHN_033579 [Nucella lapillus]